MRRHWFFFFFKNLLSFYLFSQNNRIVIFSNWIPELFIYFIKSIVYMYIKFIFIPILFFLAFHFHCLFFLFIYFHCQAFPHSIQINPFASFTQCLRISFTISQFYCAYWPKDCVSSSIRDEVKLNSLMILATMRNFGFGKLY